jgi:predicted Fe-Mo cluster-binding NifX family protein
MGEWVAPCFEYCSTMAIFTIAASGQTDEVDTLICGGMQSFYEDLLRASGFEVISWVSGLVEELLQTYLDGDLVSGTELPGEIGPDFLSMDRMMRR